MTAKAYEHLELSTQYLIEGAINRGVDVEVLDASTNTIRLKKGSVKEIVIQATRTSKDNYVSPLIMSNKYLTKLLLEEEGIQVPSGYKANTIEEALSLYETVKTTPMVVKPLSTNFGVGITILPEGFDQVSYQQALETAFHHDSTVLIETFIEGKEYRFLIINDAVIGVLHRVPANVVGDGTKTIRELIELKNEDPLRGVGYVKPLEKIKCGDFEAKYLEEQSLSFDDVPKLDEQIFLRKNSNISTGGDSIDYTDIMDPGYLKVALAGARAMGAKICGADLIIKDIHHFDPEGYSVIELNFNPAIHIHNAPYKGENRHAEQAVLDLLGF